MKRAEQDIRNNNLGQALFGDQQPRETAQPWASLGGGVCVGEPAPERNLITLDHPWASLAGVGETSNGEKLHNLGPASGGDQQRRDLINLEQTTPADAVQTPKRDLPSFKRW